MKRQEMLSRDFPCNQTLISGNFRQLLLKTT